MWSSEPSNVNIAALLSEATNALYCNEYKPCKSYLISALGIYKSDKANTDKNNHVFTNENHYFNLFYLHGLYSYSTTNSKNHRIAIKSYKKSLKYVYLDLSATLHENCNKVYKELSLCYLENNEYIQSLRYCRMINHKILQKTGKYEHLMSILELYFILEEERKVDATIKRLDEWEITQSVDIRYYTAKIRHHALFGPHTPHYKCACRCIGNKWFMKGMDLMNDTATDSKYANDFRSWAQYINMDKLEIAFDPNRSISSNYAKMYILKLEMEKRSESKENAQLIYAKNESFLNPQKFNESKYYINVPYSMFLFGILLFNARYFYCAQKYILKACKLSPELPIVKEEGNKWRQTIINIKSICHWCREISFGKKPYKKCRNCRNVYYCSKNCQKRAWNATHRYTCVDNTDIAKTCSIGYYKN